MALGVEVGLGPGHIVLDGDRAHLARKRVRAPTPIFGPFLFRPNGWMHQIPLGTEVGVSPGDFVLDGDRSPPQFSAPQQHQQHFL